MYPATTVTVLALVLLPAFSEAACGCLSLQKRYDANVNGVSDPGEVDVSGWAFKVTNLATSSFAYYNTPQTLQLPLGTYQVCDMPPQQYNWYPTDGSLCKNYTLVDSTCLNAVGLCACTGSSSARSGSFWASSSGVAVVTSDDLTALNALNLVDSSDSPITFASASQLPAWINGATSSNAQYYLSVQLAIATLNTRHGVSATAPVKAPGFTSLISQPTVFSTLAAIQSYAANLLATWSPASSTNAGIVAEALLALNQNQGYVQSDACPVTFPSYPDAASSTDFSVLCPATTGVVTTATPAPTCVLGCLDLIKFYDANGNGVQDNGEAPIQNWVFQIKNLDSGNFSYYNSTQEISGLPLGRYQVCDLASLQTNWKLTSTGGLCVNVTLTDATCVVVTRGCACTTASNAHVSGYWTTAAPPAEIDAPSISAFNSLPLFTAAGVKWTPSAATEFKNWFNLAQYYYNNPGVAMNPPGANAAFRTAYWLSAQLALSKLNSMHFISPSAVIYSPSSGVGAYFGYPYSYYTITQLQTWAVQLLATPTANLPAQNALLVALLTSNQNEGFISSSPCPFSFAPVSSPGLPSLTTVCPPPATTGFFGTTGCQQACLRIRKVYDANGNGIQDNGEPEIGSSYRVRNVATNNYAYYTAPQTIGLPFGTYEVCEQIPQQYNWYLTKGALCSTVTLSTPACVTTNNTCFCTGTGGAQSASYWLSSVGKAGITGSDLSSMASLNLRTAANALFVPPTVNDLATFIAGATSAQPSYFLSAQLALSVLNTNHFVSPSALVKAIGVQALIGGPSHGFLPLSTIQSYAVTLLATPAVNTAAQLTVANTITPVNQNQGFIQPLPCLASYAAIAGTPSKAGLLSPCTGDTAGNPSSFIINGDDMQKMDVSNAGGAGMSATVMGIIAGCVTGAVVLGAVAVVAVKKYGSRFSMVTPSRRGMDKSESQMAINLADINVNPEPEAAAASPRGLDRRRPSIVHSPSFHS